MPLRLRKGEGDRRCLTAKRLLTILRLRSRVSWRLLQKIGYMTSIHNPEFGKAYQAGIERARAYSAELVGPSLFERFARLPAAAREGILAQLTQFELCRLLYSWAAQARPKQNPDLAAVAHRILFFLGGRGSGKTMTGAQRIRKRVEAGARSIAIMGPTLRDTERYMITGEGGSDGILTVFPPSQRPEYRPHKAIIKFHTGAIAYVNSAEDPEFRGPNLDTFWGDEPAKWRYLATIWSNIELSTRLLGALPLEIMLTGTPLPLDLFKELIADEDTVTILMSQAENASNLDPTYVRKMAKKYGGTRLGRQELEGEILTDNPDALFMSSILDATRVEFAPDDLHTAVAVDPGIATNDENDPTGIVCGGIAEDGHIYILADLTSEKPTKPEKWGADVVATYDQQECSAIVGERNRGGDLVESNIRACVERKRGGVAAKAIKVVNVHATKGKYIRAEPVATLHEQGMIHIVGRMPELENEITQWNPRVGGRSPNRLDALVWLVYYLAKLDQGDDAPKKDYRAGFKGLSAAVGALQAKSAPAAPSSPLSMLPRGGWSGL